MSKNSIFAALLGAAFHDINHDGYNNAFHVSIASQLALTYNDKSVLENMHTSVGLSLMLHADSDVLDHLSTKARQEFRSLTVNMIMGTDLAVHFEQLAQFQVGVLFSPPVSPDRNRSCLASRVANCSSFLRNPQHLSKSASTSTHLPSHHPLHHPLYLSPTFHSTPPYSPIHRACPSTTPTHSPTHPRAHSHITLYSIRR